MNCIYLKAHLPFLVKCFLEWSASVILHWHKVKCGTVPLFSWNDYAANTTIYIYITLLFSRTILLNTTNKYVLLCNVFASQNQAGLYTFMNVADWLHATFSKELQRYCVISGGLWKKKQYTVSCWACVTQNLARL